MFLKSKPPIVDGLIIAAQDQRDCMGAFLFSGTTFICPRGSPSRRPNYAPHPILVGSTAVRAPLEQ